MTLVKRKINQLVFFGSEDALEKMKTLRDQLDLAMSLQSGMQQGIPTNSPEYNVAEARIESAVRDIAAGVLGMEISFVKKLPYPNNEPLHEYEIL